MKRVFVLSAILVVALAVTWRALRDPSAVGPALEPAASVRADDAPRADGLAAVEREREARVALDDARPAAVDDAARGSGSLEIAAHEGELRVAVVSKTKRRPLANVRLTLGEIPPKPGGSRNVDSARARPGEAPRTDAEGRASLVVRAGVAHSLYAFAKDVEPTEIEVAALRPGERRDLVFELAADPDARFFGRVVADEDGLPIAGARIALGASDGIEAHQERGESVRLKPRGELFDPDSPATARVVSDADGRFQLEWRSWKLPTARVVATGRTPLWTDLPHGSDAPEKALVIRLRRSAALDALVVDEGGAPVANVEVRASTSTEHLQRDRGTSYFDGEIAWASRTDASGRCRVADVPSGAPLALELVRDGESVRRESAPVVLAPGEERSVELRLGAGARIRGRLVDERDEPLIRHVVWLVRVTGSDLGSFDPLEIPAAKARTGDDGRFEFADVSDGAWRVGPAPKPSYGAFDPDAYAPIAQRVDVAPGAREFDVLVRTQRGLAIRGRVVGPDGKAAAGALVVATGTTTRFHASTHTGPGGEFTLGPLAPGEHATSATGASGRSDRIRARAGDDDVVLTLRADGAIRGRIVDAETGAPAEGVAFLVVRRHGSPVVARATIQLQDGEFALDGQEPGTYALFARTGAGTCGSRDGVEIEAGPAGAPLTIEVVPGATLRVRCGDVGNAYEFRVHAGEVCVGIDGAVEGTSTDLTVPAGRLRASLHRGADEPRGETTVEVGVGEVRDVVLGEDR